jgi:hypothetical protein
VRLEGIDAEDSSGFSVSSAGDVDGDGLDDILIGAYYADPNGNNSGETYLVFGSYLATNPGTVDLGNLDGRGVRLDGIDESDKSGWRVSSAGDVDGDGLDDILIGAQYADPNGEWSGETYLVFGKSLDGYGGYANADASDDITLTNGGVNLGNLAAHGVRLDGIAASDFSGSSVSSAGDVDGDGRDDILIGALRANNFNGEVYLVSGETLDLAADGTGVQIPGVIDLAADLGL